MGKVIWAIGLTILGLLIGVCVYAGYEWQVTWSDTGKINWIGGKQFSPDNFGTWSVPFSVVTTSHGVWNFSTGGVNQNGYASQIPSVGGFGCSGSQVGTLTVGTLYGVYRNNYGCVQLVRDP